MLILVASKITILYTTQILQEYQSIVDAEWKILYDKLDKIHQSGAKVVLSKLPIGDVATQYFADRYFCVLLTYLFAGIGLNFASGELTFKQCKINFSNLQSPCGRSAMHFCLFLSQNQAQFLKITSLIR